MARSVRVNLLVPRLAQIPFARRSAAPKQTHEGAGTATEEDFKRLFRRRLQQEESTRCMVKCHFNFVYKFSDVTECRVLHVIVIISY